MAEKKHVHCDKCDATPAEPWCVGRMGRAMARVDLCESCSTGLEDLRAIGQPAKAGDKRPYRTFKKSKTEPR